MDLNDYRFRYVTAADAAEIAVVHNQIWRDTYAGLMAQEKLSSLDDARTAQNWRDWLRGDEPPAVLGAWDVSGAVAGWIAVGVPRDEDAPVARELWVLNVVRDHHGTGLAHELMSRELGPKRAYLWVVEGNERAIAFYRKHGFEFDGGRREMSEGNVDLRMVRA